MACSPPYNCPGYEGTGGGGGFCNCDCGCCGKPPCPCYTSFTFNYSEYCGSGDQISGNISGAIGLCATVDFGNITNTFLYPAVFNITGGVDDDVLFNNVIYEDGKYSFFPPNSCGPGHGTNGSHSFTYTTILLPGQSINVKGQDNGYGGSLNANWTLTSTETGTLSNYSIVVSFSGCCMVPVSYTNNSISFVAINSGTASIANNYVGPGTLFTSIDGNPTNSVLVSNCDQIYMVWSITTPCTTAFLNTSYNLVPDCSVSPFIKIRNKLTGVEKIYLNKNKIIQRIKLRKRL